jgi:hypothetical protein
MKRKQITCYCTSYSFPHRQGGGKCEMPDFCGEPSRWFDDCIAPNDFCYYHEHNYYDGFGFVRSETLTAGERNVGAIL